MSSKTNPCACSKLPPAGNHTCSLTIETVEQRLHGPGLLLLIDNVIDVLSLFALTIHVESLNGDS
eukprot:9971831-Karenia_brevis.AAC.1